MRERQGEERMRERLNGKPLRVPPGVGQRAQDRQGRNVIEIEIVDGATGDVRIAWWRGWVGWMGP